MESGGSCWVYYGCSQALLPFQHPSIPSRNLRKVVSSQPVPSEGKGSSPQGRVVGKSLSLPWVFLRHRALRLAQGVGGGHAWQATTSLSVSSQLARGPFGPWLCCLEFCFVAAGRQVALPPFGVSPPFPFASFAHPPLFVQSRSREVAPPVLA